MYQLALLYLAAVLAGFSLIVVTLLATFLGTVAPTLVAIGAVAVIVFSLAILYLALRALFNKHLK
ncbi:hypothetical protein [Oceanobacillus halophilus]|uniref:Uncharacterized protein n=1 Tax=Oceanobacillus halophilus TaxID=930130 RepID=A0A495A1A8_9BACI|nr:hypothetical protein [Oceanobacillus halophilus]RKQ33249.1 hypothetical protein D8M06_10775 [Oceanobacillus halophilus]